MKTLTLVRRCTPKFWISTSKIMPDLWLVDLFCPIKKISTLHPSAQLWFFATNWPSIIINFLKCLQYRLLCSSCYWQIQYKFRLANSIWVYVVDWQNPSDFLIFHFNVSCNWPIQSELWFAQFNLIQSDWLIQSKFWFAHLNLSSDWLIFSEF